MRITFFEKLNWKDLQLEQSHGELRLRSQGCDLPCSGRFSVFRAPQVMADTVKKSESLFLSFSPRYWHKYPSGPYKVHRSVQLFVQYVIFNSEVSVFVHSCYFAGLRGGQLQSWGRPCRKRDIFRDNFANRCRTCEDRTVLMVDYRPIYLGGGRTLISLNDVKRQCHWKRRGEVKMEIEIYSFSGFIFGDKFASCRSTRQDRTAYTRIISMFRVFAKNSFRSSSIEFGKGPIHHRIILTVCDDQIAGLPSAPSPHH